MFRSKVPKKNEKPRIDSYPKKNLAPWQWRRPLPVSPRATHALCHGWRDSWRSLPRSPGPLPRAVSVPGRPAVVAPRPGPRCRRPKKKLWRLPGRFTYLSYLPLLKRRSVCHFLEVKGQVCHRPSGVGQAPSHQFRAFEFDQPGGFLSLCKEWCGFPWAKKPLFLIGKLI